MGPSYLPGDPEPPSSLQPSATTSHQKWRCLLPLQMWGFLPVLWEAPVLPAWVCVVGRRVEGEGGKARAVHCCLTQSRNPVPKPS